MNETNREDDMTYMNTNNDTDSHIFSPVNGLVPVQCACCNRTLTDVTSKEAGIGPVCRKKYLYEDAPSFEAHEDAAREALHNVTDTGIRTALAATLSKRDMRKFGNHLMFILATIDDSHPDNRNLIVTLDRVGFAKMARQIAKKRYGLIEVTKTGTRYAVKSPYSDAYVSRLRSLPRTQGAPHWDSKKKVWIVPAQQRRGLFEALKAGYPGAFLSSAQGLSILPA